MKVLGYIRVSTKGQIDAYGLDVQRRDIEGFCAKNGYEIVGWYEDAGVSGALEHRPSLDRLMYGEVDAEAVVVGRSDRIARDIEIYYAVKHQLKTKGLDLISVSEDFSGPYAAILEAVLAAMAEIERGVIKERTSAGRSAKAVKGGYSGGNAPYGYRIVGGEYEVDESEAALVRDVFSFYGRMSYNEMIEALKSKGYKTRKGTDFTIGGIRSILSNRKMYEGFYRYGKHDWVKGRHKPILN